MSLRPHGRNGCEGGRVRVLGVDPGLTRCGIGVVDGRAGRRAVLVSVEVVRTPADAPLADRLMAVCDAIDAAITLYRPDAMAVERVFSQQNVQSVMGTAQASGVALLAGARAGVPVALHTPTEVKAAVTGSGRAGKEQVAAMVVRILGLEAAPRPADAADALALAICHLWRGAAADVPIAPEHPAAQPTAAQLAWAEATRAAQTRATQTRANPVVGRATPTRRAARRA